MGAQRRSELDAEILARSRRTQTDRARARVTRRVRVVELAALPLVVVADVVTTVILR